MRTTIFPINPGRPFFWNMGEELKEVMDNVENIWEEVYRETANVKETDQAYLVSLDMPGVGKKDLDIQIEGEQLIVNATRKHTFAESQKFSKTIGIPKLVDRDKIQAHCEDGVLYLALPKMEKALPKKVALSEGSKLLGMFKKN